jgi:hypothetical protein
VDKHLEVWKDRIRTIYAVVKFGDSKTSQESQQNQHDCWLTRPHRALFLRITGDTTHGKQDGDEYNRNVKILPRVNVLKPIEPIRIAEDDELPEWIKQDVEPCVEEEETPDPCSFTGPLNYLTMSLESHISENFLKHIPEIKEYLLSDKCKAVFVPEVWQGIKGIYDLRVQAQDSLPSLIKPPAMPVNKRVFELAQKEFERMLMHTKSESPWASPLVIAPYATKMFIRICRLCNGQQLHSEVALHYTERLTRVTEV